MKTVLITGASQGIGKQTAKLFAKSGWDLLLVSRDKGKLIQLKDELLGSNISVNTLSLDFLNKDKINKQISKFVLQCGIPSVLINNAGVAWTGALLEMPLEKWDSMLQINLTSVFQICSSVVPFMRESGGLVINISSHAARNAFPQWGAYCVTKAALSSFTKCLEEEERRHSIRATTITLGAVNTPLWDSSDVNSDFDRNSMLSSSEVAKMIFDISQTPANQLVEDITLMPSGGAF